MGKKKFKKLKMKRKVKRIIKEKEKDNKFVNVDTLNRCFFCFQNIITTDTASSNPPTGKTARKRISPIKKKIPEKLKSKDDIIQKEIKLISIKSICRYLDFRGEGIKSFPVNDKSSICVKLCVDCKKEVDKFRKLYLDYQLAKMKLDGCLQSICGNMVNVPQGSNNGKLNDPMDVYQPEVIGNEKASRQLPLVKELRLKLQQKWDKKTEKQLPRVYLKPLLNDTTTAQALQSEGVTGSDDIFNAIASYNLDSSPLPMPSNKETAKTKTIKSPKTKINSLLQTKTTKTPILNTKKYKCRFCCRGFNKKSRLQVHLRLHGTEKTSFHCIICSATFPTKTELNYHVSNVHKRPDLKIKLNPRRGRPKKLEFKNLPFSSISKPARSTSVTLDVNSNSNKTPQPRPRPGRPRKDEKCFPQKCSQCPKIFQNGWSLSSHKQTVHMDLQFRCNKCPQIFKEIVHWRRHILLHDKEKPSKIKKVMKQGNLEKKNKKKLTKSPQMPEPSKPEPKEITINNAAVARPFNCDLCGKSFKQKNNLIAHRRIHSGERPFKCPHCDNTFTRSNNMKSHIERMHSTVSHPLTASTSSIPNGTTKPHSCEVCHKNFKTVHDLQLHREDKHLKQYSCQFCSSIFASQKKLRKHVSNCSAAAPKDNKRGERKSLSSNRNPTNLQKGSGSSKKFKCSHCGKTFAHQYKLSEHIRSHTGYKPYQCAFCHSRHAQKAHLIRHVQMAHFTNSAYGPKVKVTEQVPPEVEPESPWDANEEESIPIPEVIFGNAPTPPPINGINCPRPEIVKIEMLEKHQLLVSKE